MTVYKFGKKSSEKINQLHNTLRLVARLALSWGIMDFAIIEGIRSKEKQNQYFAENKTKVQWPNGKHNVEGVWELSKAFDAVPCINGRISWHKDHCLVLSGIMLAAAKTLNVNLRWGGNWDMDGEPVTDQTFQDLVHFELN